MLMYLREENPSKVTHADIVVGIPSFKEADSIAYPTEQVSLGLKKYFPNYSSVIINADNHSPDKTEEVFLNTNTEIPKIYITTPPDTPGKGFNIENLFRKAHELKAKVFICVDADLLSITPEWIKYFAEPILDGYDYVTPVYSRHKYDGTITNAICYPLIYSLFCKDIRQPIGGDFALSAPLMDHIICQPWHTTTEEYGVDIFMSMNAIAGGFKVCKTGLGSKKHKPSAPKLGPMFTQVVSTAFLIITRTVEEWRTKNSIEEAQQFGLQHLDPPQDLDVDRESIKAQAIAEFTAQRELLQKVINPETFSQVDAMYASGDINISAKQWALMVFDIISNFQEAEDRLAMVNGLKGLYFGRTFSFMNKTWDMSSEEAEVLIKEQAQCFFDNRHYLIDKLSQK